MPDEKGKVSRSDNICIEHIKASWDILMPLWLDLYNKCLETKTIPRKWRTSIIKILYKGKGERSNPNSYRGVALKSNPFKIYAKYLTMKLQEETKLVIPECQFGFRKGRNTIQAAKCLIDQIKDALNKPHGKYYAVFINYSKAFDLIDRKNLMQKIEAAIGENQPLYPILKDILSCNYIQIDDGVTTSNIIRQTNGVLQGDPISPLLFNIATADITQITENASETTLITWHWGAPREKTCRPRYKDSRGGPKKTAS